MLALRALGQGKILVLCRVGAFPSETGFGHVATARDIAQLELQIAELRAELQRPGEWPLIAGWEAVGLTPSAVSPINVGSPPAARSKSRSRGAQKHPISRLGGRASSVGPAAGHRHGELTDPVGCERLGHCRGSREQQASEERCRTRGRAGHDPGQRRRGRTAQMQLRCGGCRPCRGGAAAGARCPVPRNRGWSPRFLAAAERFGPWGPGRCVGCRGGRCPATCRSERPTLP